MPQKHIHGLFDKIRQEEQRVVVNKCHALKVNFADSFQHGFSVSLFTVSCELFPSVKSPKRGSKAVPGTPTRTPLCDEQWVGIHLD